MFYEALYYKYCPQTFTNLVRQDAMQGDLTVRTRARHYTLVKSDRITSIEHHSSDYQFPIRAIAFILYFLLTSLASETLANAFPSRGGKHLRDCCDSQPRPGQSIHPVPLFEHQTLSRFCAF